MSLEQRKEFRFSLTQLVILLGFMSGCLAIMYGFGYLRGKQFGHELAMESQKRDLVPLQIPHSELSPSEVDEEIGSRIYDELSEEMASNRQAGELPGGDEKLPNFEESEVPSLQQPKTDESRQVARLEDLESEPETPKARVSASSLVDQPNARVLNGAADRSLQEEVGALQKELLAENNRGEQTQDGSDKAREQGAIPRADTERADPPADDDVTEPTRTTSSSSSDTTDEQVTGNLALERAGQGDEKKPEQDQTAEVPEGWYVQVAAPEKLGDAQSISRKLKAAGFPVLIQQTKVRGIAYYRILVGPEVSRTFAERLLAQVRAEPYISGQPFVKRAR